MLKQILPGEGISSSLRFVLLVILAVAIQSEGATLDKSQTTPDGPSQPARFDSQRAFNHAKSIVKLGPRTPGSEANRKARDYIKGELRSYGLQVSDDQFEARTPKGSIAMANIVGELPGEKPEVVMIAGHYDTKILTGFVGANDGGSSTASVLELARVLSKSRPEYTLWFVFFDGEEAVVDWDANDGMDNTYGSRHMASRLAASGAITRVKAMILLDMIGDSSLDLRRDGESTPWLVDLIWTAARNGGHGKHFLDEDGAYSDDHIPFKKAGIPVVNLIDFNYGPDNSYWHTKRDTLDKVSGDSMKIVGDVVINALPDLFKRLKDVGPKIDRRRPKG